MSTKTYFIISERPGSIGYDFECRYEAPGVDRLTSLSTYKTRSEKHGARLHCHGLRFGLSGSGYIQRECGEKYIRKATAEYAKKLDDLQEQIHALQAQFRALLFEAHARGEKVHASDAVNYPKPLESAQADSMRDVAYSPTT